MAVGILDSVPVTWGMLFVWGVVRDTAGASCAGTFVGLDAKFGVGTTTIALPPGAWNVGLAAGWAAPPPTTGARGDKAVGVAWAAGAGEGDAAGVAGGPSFATGGVCPGSVQFSINPATTITIVSDRRLNSAGTR